MEVSVILSHKGSQVHSIPPDATVFEAIHKMSEKNVGALLVMSGDRLEGVVSERDYTRKIALKGRQSKDTRVREIMTSPVVTIGPDSHVDECLQLVTDRRVALAFPERSARSHTVENHRSVVKPFERAARASMQINPPRLPASL